MIVKQINYLINRKNSITIVDLFTFLFYSRASQLYFIIKCLQNESAFRF